MPMQLMRGAVANRQHSGSALISRGHADVLTVYSWRQDAEDFRRVATRYDKLARNFFASVQIAAIVAYWL
jgi:transposase